LPVPALPAVYPGVSAKGAGGAFTKRYRSHFAWAVSLPPSTRKDGRNEAFAGDRCGVRRAVERLCCGTVSL